MSFLNLSACFLQNLHLQQFRYCHWPDFAFKMGSWEEFVLGQRITGIFYEFLPVEVTSQSALKITLKELEIQLH